MVDRGLPNLQVMLETRHTGWRNDAHIQSGLRCVKVCEPGNEEVERQQGVRCAGDAALLGQGRCVVLELLQQGGNPRQLIQCMQCVMQSCGQLRSRMVIANNWQGNVQAPYLQGRQGAVSLTFRAGRGPYLFRDRP